MSDLSKQNETVKILVVDEINGPADVLLATLDLLLEQRIAINTVSDHLRALVELSTNCYDLVAIGLSAKRSNGLNALITRIQARRPDLPVIAVSRQPNQKRAHQPGLGAVVSLPRRAAELRALAGRVAQQYLF